MCMIFYATWQYTCPYSIFATPRHTALDRNRPLFGQSRQGRHYRKRRALPYTTQDNTPPLHPDRFPRFQHMGRVPVLKRAALERPHRKLSENVPFGVGIILVEE